MKSQTNLFLIILIFHLTLNTNICAQDSAGTKKWFIALPLRFTHLQSTNTMLSGIKIGHQINTRCRASLSIYHSFYFKSFKAPANVNGYAEQPRLFINCMGAEFEYYFLKRKKVAVGLQLLLGWGFMTYDLEKHEFDGKQVNYAVAEPALNLEYKINHTSSIGFGIGYRPLLTNRPITYTSNISKGEIPISKQFPNGLNFLLCFKGFF